MGVKVQSGMDMLSYGPGVESADAVREQERRRYIGHCIMQCHGIDRCNTYYRFISSRKLCIKASVVWTFTIARIIPRSNVLKQFCSITPSDNEEMLVKMQGFSPIIQPYCTVEFLRTG